MNVMLGIDETNRIIAKKTYEEEKREEAMKSDNIQRTQPVPESPYYWSPSDYISTVDSISTGDTAIRTRPSSTISILDTKGKGTEKVEAQWRDLVGKEYADYFKDVQARAE